MSVPDPSWLVLVGLSPEEAEQARDALGQLGLADRVQQAEVPATDVELGQVVEEALEDLALQQRLATAARELRVLEAAMAQARDGMVVTDVFHGEGGPRIQWCNPAFSAIVGEDAEALVGQPLLHCAPLRSARRRIVHALAKHGTWEGEVSFGPLDGLRTLEVRFGGVRNAEGEPVHHVGVLRDITDKKRVEDRLQHLAHHDHLTGLPNRKLLLDRLTLALARARRYAAPLGILFVDLDGFKAINDSLGHGAGDQVLVSVASRLRGLVRASDTVARLGGDEFVILLPEVRAIENASRVASKVLDHVSEVIQVGDHELFVTPSIGLSLWPDHGDSVEELLQRADQAMYAAKAAGKAATVIWGPELATRERTRADRLAELREGFAQGAFHLDAQPIIDTRTGPVAVQALLRWTHPERGPVSPASFLPYLEEAGLVPQVLRSIALHGGRAAAARGLALSFDVRPEWLGVEGAVDTLKAALDESGLPAHRCWLEVAESHLMDLPGVCLQALQELRELGVRVVVDHYGTSHLSLPLLRRLPLDMLKLHASLTEAVGRDDALIRGIITLCRSLELDLVAAGVGGFAQRDGLSRLGLTVQEGPFHGRPGPLADVVAGLGRSSAAS